MFACYGLWWEVVLYSVGEADSDERFIVGGSSVERFIVGGSSVECW